MEGGGGAEGCMPSTAHVGHKIHCRGVGGGVSGLRDGGGRGEQGVHFRRRAAARAHA